MVATEVRIRRGTASQHASFTGAQGELTYVTDSKELRIHDGVTAGGILVGPATIVVHGLQSIQVFTSTGTWTRPAGITLIKVRLVGGGGGGGGQSATLDRLGGGGGGGGYSEEVIDVSAISSDTFSVGAAGAAGTSTGNGGTGGTTSFGASAFLSATGGVGGNVGAANAPGAAGGIGSGGDVNIKGQGTHPTSDIVDRQGSGAGGSSILGGGAQSPQPNATSTQFVGGNYGGGGSGGGGGSAGVVGGAGAPGIVIVEEYIK